MLKMKKMSNVMLSFKFYIFQIIFLQIFVQCHPPVYKPMYVDRRGNERNLRTLRCETRSTNQVGVCMFSWNCMKEKGIHLGTCIDGFYVGSCCMFPEGKRTTVFKNIPVKATTPQILVTAPPTTTTTLSTDTATTSISSVSHGSNLMQLVTVKKEQSTVSTPIETFTNAPSVTEAFTSEALEISTTVPIEVKDSTNTPFEEPHNPSETLIEIETEKSFIRSETESSVSVEGSTVNIFHAADDLKLSEESFSSSEPNNPMIVTEKTQEYTKPADDIELIHQIMTTHAASINAQNNTLDLNKFEPNQNIFETSTIPMSNLEINDNSNTVKLDSITQVNTEATILELPQASNDSDIMNHTVDILNQLSEFLIGSDEKPGIFFSNETDTERVLESPSSTPNTNEISTENIISQEVTKETTKNEIDTSPEEVYETSALEKDKGPIYDVSLVNLNENVVDSTTELSAMDTLETTKYPLYSTTDKFTSIESTTASPQEIITGHVTTEPIASSTSSSMKDSSEVTTMPMPTTQKVEQIEPEELGITGLGNIVETTTFKSSMEIMKNESDNMTAFSPEQTSTVDYFEGIKDGEIDSDNIDSTTSESLSTESSIKNDIVKDTFVESSTSIQGELDSTFTSTMKTPTETPLNMNEGDATSQVSIDIETDYPVATSSIKPDDFDDIAFSTSYPNINETYETDDPIKQSNESLTYSSTTLSYNDLVTEKLTQSTTNTPTTTVESVEEETERAEVVTEAPSTTAPEVTSLPKDQLLEHLNSSDFRDVCGKQMYPSRRIVGGALAGYGEFPWQASLRQWRSVTYLHKCGAALVNRHWAITAAHCVENAQPDQVLLRFGEYDLERSTEPYQHVERKVQIIATHPQFDPRTFEYDLALLRFSEPVPFQPNILPICIPDSDYDFIGDTGYVTGWGRLYEEGPLPSTLQKVPVPVITNAECEVMYRNAGYIEAIPNIFICAGYEAGKRDSCEGDSGGPLVIKHGDSWKLAGVISWGIGCALPNQPGVYTRISAFRDWVNKIIVF